MIKALRRWTFPDGTQVGVTGLDAVMDNLCREGRPADLRTAADIMSQLKTENYFEPSAKQAHVELFLRKHERILARRLDLLQGHRIRLKPPVAFGDKRPYSIVMEGYPCGRSERRS